MTEPRSDSGHSPSLPAFLPGFHFLPGCLGKPEQGDLLEDVKHILSQAPLFVQRMPKTGAPLSVKMSNAGKYGWVTDREQGYRYQAMHPVSGNDWPPIPQRLLRLWEHLTQERLPANQCLINFYDDAARLGLHQDKGEFSTQAPVVSISLGDDASFVIGGMTP